MTTLQIPIADDQLALLEESARQLHMTPEELVLASIKMITQRQSEEVERGIDYVLEKNAELYRRLA